MKIKDVLKRPEINYSQLCCAGLAQHGLEDAVKEQVEINIKYEGYIQRQQQMVKKHKKLEEKKIFPSIDYSKIAALSTEAREKLARIKPMTLGQASRISGITPAAISILMVYLKKHETKS